MGIILIFIAIIVVSLILESNKFVLKHDLEDMFSLTKWIGIVFGTIVSFVLFLQITTRGTDFTEYTERLQVIYSYANHSETLALEEKTRLMDKIKSHNKGITNSKKYGDNFFVGMFYNPLIVDMELISYDIISQIPLHQNSYVNVGNEVIEN